MGKKTETQEQEKQYGEQEIDLSPVYDLTTLFELRFRDPLNGATVKVRRAFKPRGKLEFYHPEE